MNALAKASRAAAQMGARTFASGAYPERKVAVLGAAGEALPRPVRAQMPNWGSQAADGGPVGRVQAPALPLPALTACCRCDLTCSQAASASPCRC